MSRENTLEELSKMTATSRVQGWMMAFILHACLCTFETGAQTIQAKSVFTNGSGVSVSAGSIHRASLGETFVGNSQSSGAIVISGFLAGQREGLALASADVLSTSFPQTYEIGTGGLQVAITVDDAALVQRVDFLFKGLSVPDATFSEQASITPDGNTFTATISDADFSQELAVVYEFEINNRNGSVEISGGLTYATIADGTESIAGLRFGTLVSNYQIVALPYDLTDKGVLSIFDELAPYDNTKWRLFHYTNGQTNEFGTFSTIDVGKGYWLIVADPTEITLGAGAVPQVNQASPYELTLQPGWNQIGNPYTYAINWGAVLAANGDPAGIGNLFQLSGSTLGQSNSLAAFRGGFVENTTDAPVTIQIPPNKSAIGGRRSQGTHEGMKSSISQPEWEVGLKISDGQFTNALGGIGMRLDANEGQDRYDISLFPTPFDLAEVSFGLEERELSKSVVPSVDHYSWNFSVEGPDQTVELSWENGYFGANEKELVMIDLSTNRMIDMRRQDRIMLNPARSNEFQILYGEQSFIDEHAIPKYVGLGDIYPNPVQKQMNIPFALAGTGSSGYEVTIVVVDIMGRVVSTVLSENLVPGFHTVEWDTSELENGIYQVMMEVSGGGEQWKMTKRILK